MITKPSSVLHGLRQRAAQLKTALFPKYVTPEEVNAIVSSAINGKYLPMVIAGDAYHARLNDVIKLGFTEKSESVFRTLTKFQIK